MAFRLFSHLLLVVLLAGRFTRAGGDNISIQYVIIHSTSNVSNGSPVASSSSVSSHASLAPPPPSVYPSSSPSPVFFSTATAIATATSMTSDGVGPNEPSSYSQYSPVAAPSSSSLLRMAVRGSEHLFALTYEHQIPGQPGKDYPIHAEVPTTNFDCEHYEQRGYFADEQSGCQVIHICQGDGSRESFLCPNGTIFNQQYLVCDWWFNVDCSKSRAYYNLNADLGPSSEVKPKVSAQKVQQPLMATIYSAEESSAEIAEYSEGDDTDIKRNVRRR